jgi:hypothetical protein
MLKTEFINLPTTTKLPKTLYVDGAQSSPQYDKKSIKTCTDVSKHIYTMQNGKETRNF